MANKTPKIHAFCPEPERGMPIDISKEMYAKGLRGTKCGFMRKVAFDQSQVTCFYCLRKLAANYGNSRSAAPQAQPSNRWADDVEGGGLSLPRIEQGTNERTRNNAGR